MLDVSIITPVYHGNKYLNGLLNNIEKNAENAKGLDIELILVNDSPEIPLQYDRTIVKQFRLKCLNNQKNLGIQRSRINGIKEADGKYIIMLDQDDCLSDKAIISQFKAIGQNEVVVGNGLNELENKNVVPLFKSLKQQIIAQKYRYYFYYGNVIASPGMCMIKKTAIPKIWMEYPLEINGADDWLLWVTVLAEGNTMSINEDQLYVHRNVGSNCSSNLELMQRSSLEALNIFRKQYKEDEKLSKIYLRRLKMRIEYEGKGMWRKLFAYLKNPDIAWYLFKYKIYGYC